MTDNIDSRWRSSISRAELSSEQRDDLGKVDQLQPNLRLQVAESTRRAYRPSSSYICRSNKACVSGARFTRMKRVRRAGAGCDASHLTSRFLSWGVRDKESFCLSWHKRQIIQRGRQASIHRAHGSSRTKIVSTVSSANI